VATDEFDSALHVSRSCHAGTLKSAGFSNCVILADWLVWGPSLIDDKKHLRNRGRWLRKLMACKPALGLALQTVRMRNLRSVIGKKIGAKTKLVFWNASTWGGTLDLIWFASLAETLDVPGLNLYIIRNCNTPLELPFDKLDEARPVSMRQLQTLADLWRAYCDPDPNRFAERMKENQTLFGSHEDLFQAFFATPRVCGSGWRLAAVDQAMLGFLHALGPRSWRRAGDMVSELFFSNLFQRLEADMILWLRLAEWVAQGVAFECSTDKHGRIRLRLTDSGRRLVEEGCDKDSRPPTLHIGGCTSSGSGHFWGNEQAAARPEFFKIRWNEL
jgi:hypothetical protein